MVTPLALATLALIGGSEASFILDGKVLDPSHSAIPAARVAAIPMDRQTGGSAQTDATGAFRLALAPGAYQLSISASGFLGISQPLVARSGEGERREFVLVVAPFAEAITVRAQGPYGVNAITTSTKTPTFLRDVPQSVSVIRKELVRDQLMLSLADVVRYTPGIQAHQGENNRDQVIIRGNNSSADFFLNGVRDDAQYHRDLYNLDRVEALKGPNAMIFGRGGGGGVVNRVTKEAESRPVRELTLQGGDHGHKRIAGDLGGALSDRVAVRINGMYENSASFRSHVGVERVAINPTLTFAASPDTRIRFGYEHLHDTRVADRGITSFAGVPADVDISTFYGNPADSHVRAAVDLGTVSIEHQAGALTLRNRTMYGAYDRFYQNYVPGAVSPDKSRVILTAYNSASRRANAFNQTDVLYTLGGGGARHRLLAGVELGRQNTDNFRNTGFFDNAATALSVPYSQPTIATPVTYRQRATDADNHLEASVAAVYFQDQVELSPSLQVLGGLRFDRFNLDYRDNRSDHALSRRDTLTSPRAAIVYKPIAPLSVYASYTVSYLPSSGDQFSSLTDVTQQVRPEAFGNYELGANWEPRPALAVTAALYRLDRTNTRATDPGDAARIVQTGSQRTEGIEIGLTGRVTSAWSIAGGYSFQDARVTRSTTAARSGARVGQVPRHGLSLWNHYRISPSLAAALGFVLRSEMFAAIDNTVILPGYARIDFGVFYALTPRVRLQANLENAFDKAYWLNADGNTNLSPGHGRVLRVALAAGF